MWTRVRAFLFLATLTLAASASAGNLPISGFQETVFQGGLSRPTAIAFLPDGRLLITEKGGALKLSDGTSVSTLITSRCAAHVEMGLLGVAVDPTSRATASSTCTAPTTAPAAAAPRDASTRSSASPWGRVTPSTPRRSPSCSTGAQTDNGNHDGGCLRIGPDGKLYVGVGDTGLGDQVRPGQLDQSVRAGPELAQRQGPAPEPRRLDSRRTIPSSARPASVARSSPTASATRSASASIRSPASLWVADVGDLTVEEIDIVTSGGNYAWPHCEGTLPSGCEQPGDIDPIFTYPHSGAELPRDLHHRRRVLARHGFGGLDNDYFFGDCTCSKHLQRGPDRRPAQRRQHTRELPDRERNTPSDVDLRPGWRALLRLRERRRGAPRRSRRLRRRSARLRLQAHAEGQRRQPGEEVALLPVEGRHRARRRRRRSDRRGRLAPRGRHGLRRRHTRCPRPTGLPSASRRIRRDSSTRTASVWPVP